MKNYLKKVKEILALEPDPAFARRAKIVFQNLELCPGQKVMDLGCGRGFYLKTLAAFNLELRLYGVDLNSKYLKLAAKIVPRKALSLVKAEATALSFRDNFFDRVIASEVLEHIKDDQKALGEIYRVLKEGGIAMITVPHKNYPFCWDPLNWTLERLFNWHIPSNIWWLAGLWADHLRLYTQPELAKKIKQAGFKIEKSWNITHYCFPFSHFLFYGLGKNLVEKGLLRSFNRFSSSPKHSWANKLFLWPIRKVDGLNQEQEALASVNLVFKVRKP